MVFGFEVEFLADTLQFIELGLLQRVVGAEELRRGIHHGGVEKLLEHFIAQVVMRGNIFL